MARVEASKENVEKIKEHLRNFRCEVDPILETYSENRAGKPDDLAMIYQMLASLNRSMIKNMDTIARQLQASEISWDKHFKVEKLSCREQEVLLLLAKGCSYHDVAEIIGCKHATTQTYVKRIYKKLNVHSRSEAVFEAASLGIINLYS